MTAPPPETPVTSPAGERVAPEDDLRARALERLLPALVHRLNNAMAVIQGVHELGERAPGRDREHARAEIRTVGQILARLGALARRPSRHEQVVDLGAVLLAHHLLLRPLAESLGVELETRPVAPLTVHADARLESLLLALCTEALVEQHGRARRSLRLSVRAVAGEARLVVAAPGVSRPPAALGALADLARERGARLRSRSTPGCFGLRLSFPLPRGAEEVPEVRPARRPRRVLLVHRAGEERELVATVLREHGCTVSESPGLPSGGTFDLALVERHLALAEPALVDGLRARLTVARVATLEPCLRPQELLQLIRE